MTNTEIDVENQLIITRLIRKYLSNKPKPLTLDEACISGRTMSNRTSVPPDAVTVRYLIEHPDQDWSLAVRAVWRSGQLMPPLAVHVVVERYWSEDDNLEAARSRANDWLRSMNL